MSNDSLYKSRNSALFACSKCFSRHPFEELSSSQQYCKDCRGSQPIVKCTYCRTEFQQTNKVSSICGKCESNVKQFGKPTACEYCNIIAAFIGNKCQRCTNSERKYGPPVTCEQCKQKCAFDRKDDDKKVDGKLLCWLCTLSFKRALAKTKHGEAERRASRTQPRPTPARPREPRSNRGSKRSTGGETEDSPGAKASRQANHRPPLPVEPVDPNSSDHVVAMTQLKEQMASLQKQLVVKDSQLLSKDKMITELKAKHFTLENELRQRMKTESNNYDKKVEMMSSKIKSLQKEVASLSKNQKKSIGGSTNIATGGGSGGSGFQMLKLFSVTG